MLLLSFCEGMLDASYVPKEETYISEKTLTPTKFEKANFRKFEESSVYLDSSLYESDRNLKVLPSLDKRKPYNHCVYTKQSDSDSVERMRRDDYSTQFEFFKGGGMDSFNISTSTSNTTTVWSDSKNATILNNQTLTFNILIYHQRYHKPVNIADLSR